MAKKTSTNTSTTETLVEASHSNALSDQKKNSSKEISIEDKLRALYSLQCIDKNITKIYTIRGELPLEVRDLEDEIEGLHTRLGKLNDEIARLKEQLSRSQSIISESNESIIKYKDQQMNIRNNREFDALNKEIEFQELEIQLNEKKAKEYTLLLETKTAQVTSTETEIVEKQGDLKAKQEELNSIVEETEKEEQELLAKSEQASVIVDQRLLAAYSRIRNSFINGLAVVPVSRDACGGCFNRIPIQRTLDIRIRKKVIVCEYCGRILVDAELAEEVEILNK